MKKQITAIIIVIALIILLIPKTLSETRYDRNSKTETYNYATGYQLITGTYVSGGVANLQAADSSYIIFDNGTSGVLDVWFNGTSSGHIPFLQLYNVLKMNVSVNCLIECWDFWNSRWTQVGETMYRSISTATSNTGYYSYQVMNGTQYRKTTGEWSIRFYMTSAVNAYRASIDYQYYRTTGFDLGTSNTATSSSSDQDVQGLSVGIRPNYIYLDANGYEYEKSISASTVATVTGPGSSGYLSNTWACPLTGPVNCTIVRIYQSNSYLRTIDPSSGGIPLGFITEDTNDYITSATWNVTYHFTYSAILDETFFDFGSSTKASRIEGFTHGSAVSWHTIATWYELLATRQWNAISTWYELLNTRQWSVISTWFEILNTRQWNVISIWYEILGPSWHTVAVWYEMLGPETTAWLAVAILGCIFVTIMLGIGLIKWRSRI